MTFRPALESLTLAVALGAILPTPAAAQSASVTLIEDAKVLGMTSDGGQLAGLGPESVWGGSAPGLDVALRWSWDGTPLPISGAGYVTDVSTSGWVAAGSQPGLIAGGSYPARWTLFGGWSTLPLPSSFGGYVPYGFTQNAMSDNGSVLVGSIHTPPNADPRAYRYTSSGGTVVLPDAPGTVRSSARAVSADGLVVGGSVVVPHPSGTGYTERPCLWYPTSASPFFLLPYPDPDVPVHTELGSTAGDGEVYALDEHGTAVLGVDESGDVFLWRAGQGVTLIPKPVDGSLAAEDMWPTDVANGGDLVLGNGGNVAWLWTPQGGTLTLRRVLQDVGLGAETEADVTTAARVSSDGRRVAGGLASYGACIPCLPEGPAMLLELPDPTTFGAWDDLGGSLAAPFAPVPSLRGAGLQLAGASTTLVVGGMPLFGTASLVVGVSRVDAPFKGGVLVPHPDVVLPIPLFGLPSPFTLDFEWPAGLPAGLELYWQVWTANGTGPQGFTATNALRSVTG